MSGVALTRREKLHRRGVRLEWFTVGWNVIEAVVAVSAGLVAGSVSLVSFGADSLIEVIAAVALLWRLRQAGPRASAEEHGAAEKRVLYVVAATFLLLAGYIAFESASGSLGLLLAISQRSSASFLWAFGCKLHSLLKRGASFDCALVARLVCRPTQTAWAPGSMPSLLPPAIR